MPTFVLGFADFAKAMKNAMLDAGEPLEDEVPMVGPGDYVLTRQRTTTGTMFWLKDLNLMMCFFKNGTMVNYNGGNLKIV